VWLSSTISSTSASPPRLAASCQVCALVRRISGVSMENVLLHAEIERLLHGVERVAATVGVA
jgi:hypothetical protein